MKNNGAAVRGVMMWWSGNLLSNQGCGDPRVSHEENWEDCARQRAWVYGKGPKRANMA